MNDLISREALKKALKSNCDLCHDKNTNWCEHCCPLNDFEDLIDNAPAVNVKDQIAGAYNEGYMCGNKEAEKARPQGEWVAHEDMDEWYECNKCHCGNTYFDKLPRYCPNCGAEMEKGGAE